MQRLHRLRFRMRQPVSQGDGYIGSGFTSNRQLILNAGHPAQQTIVGCWHLIAIQTGDCISTNSDLGVQSMLGG